MLKIVLIIYEDNFSIGIVALQEGNNTVEAIDSLIVHGYDVFIFNGKVIAFDCMEKEKS